MDIIEEKFYSMKCHGCGIFFEMKNSLNKPRPFKTDSKSLLIEIAGSLKWKKIKGNWYCPECCEENE